MAAETVPVFLLCGGLGTRLRAHDATRPKPLVPVLGRPFVAWLIEHLARAGYTRFVLSIGYLAEQFEAYPWQKEFPGIAVELFREDSPLGTGGAVEAWLKAHPAIASAWVVNGDTWLEAGLLPEAEARARLGRELDALYLALAQSEVFDAKPNLEVESSGRLLAVAETPAARYFDAGAVFLTRAALEGSAPLDPPFSLHRLLGPVIGLGRVAAHVVEGTCYDIGTPERIARFEARLKRP